MNSISGIILFLAFLSFAILIWSGNLTPELEYKPPRAIRLIGIMEATFAAIVIMIGIYFFVDKNPFGTLIVITGLLWILLITYLYKAKVWAKNLLLILSIARTITIFGIIFSAPTIFLLLFSKSIKCYFIKEETEHS